MYVFGTVVKDHIAMVVWAYFCVLYSIGSPVFIAVSYYFCYGDCMVKLEVSYCETFSIALFVQHCLAIQSFLYFFLILGFFSTSVKNVIRFLIEIF
jgi:hypothetical protein